MRSIHLPGAGFAFLTTVTVGTCLTCCSRAALPTDRRVEVALSPVELDADGWSESTLLVKLQPRAASDIRPAVSIPDHSQAATILGVNRTPSGWAAQIRAGTIPGTIRLVTMVPGFRSAQSTLSLKLAASDRASDGTPDFLRLDD